VLTNPRDQECIASVYASFLLTGDPFASGPEHLHLAETASVNLLSEPAPDPIKVIIIEKEFHAKKCDAMKSITRMLLYH